MKTLGKLGSAVLVAVASMAVMGASPATASEDTVLCKTHEEPCSPMNQLTHLHLEATTATLLAIAFGTPITVDCGASALLEMLDLGQPQVGHFLSLFWTECETHNGHECDV
jgi:hypothetical protein